MWHLSLSLILSTFGIIFLAELPDKTAIAALVLATQYKARDVIFGAWLALAAQTIIAVLAGSVLTLLPVEPVRLAAGAGFLVFAFLAFRRKEDEIEKEEAQDIAKAKKHPVWLTSFLIIFAAELGDLTQLATAALVAQHGQPLSVGIGALLALWTVTVIAVVSGAQLHRFISPQKLSYLSGVLFAAIGFFIIVSTLA